MNYHTLPGTALTVSDVCLGTMTWGEQNAEPDAHAQLDYAWAQGINFIDTAEMYPVPPNARTQGRTEAILGRWIARRSRSELVIATKVAGPGRRDWIRGGRTDLTRDVIAEAIEAYAALARKRGMTLVELALGYVKSRQYLGAVIIGATTMAQLEEDIAAAQRALDAQTLAEIAAIQVRFPNPAG